MITTYRKIGQMIMQRDNYSNMPPLDQHLYIVRQFCVDDSGYNNKKTGTFERLFIMNLDTVNTKISFNNGDQIDDGACAKYLIFKNYAPGDTNFYAAHNGYKSIFSFELVDYIISNRKKIRWTDPSKVQPCIEFLQQIRDAFFYTDRNILKPKYTLLPESQQKGFPDPELTDSLQLLTDDKKYKKEHDKITKKYFEKSLLPENGDKPAYAITIDGKFMHEHELVSTCYLDVLYYHFLDKQLQNSNAMGSCHACSRIGSLSADVSLNQKFYGSTNPTFYDCFANNRSYTAFSLCEKCYKEIIVGMRYAGTNLRTRLLGLSCIILPEFDHSTSEYHDLLSANNMKSIVNVLKRQDRNEHQQTLNLIRNLQLRLSRFSLFFYSKPSPTSQEFIIGRFIKGISIKSLVEKTEDLDRLTLSNKLVEVFNDNYGLSFEGLRYMLLPSTESHPDMRPKDKAKPPDYQRINREMLSLLSKYLYSHEFDYKKLIRLFVDIFSRKYIHVDDQFKYGVDLSPFVMNMYLKHLMNFRLITIPINKEDRTMTTKLEDKDILNYFENNAETYLDNKYAQGLFLLGKFLSEIEYEQKKPPKEIKRTAISKLNLRGIPVQRILSVIATINDLREIWVEYRNPVTDAYFMECMTGIEKSTLSPEEVVFHIISGRAYAIHTGILRGKIKKQKLDESKQEEENDQQ